MIYMCDYENYINDLWKKIDNNIFNWDFSGEFVQKHLFKNIVIKYNARIKGIKCLDN